MVHLLDSKLSHLEQRHDGEQPADGTQTMQGPRQRDHSLEAPAVLSMAPPQGFGLPHVPRGTPAGGGHAVAKLPTGQSSLQQEPQSRNPQQQHTIETPSLVSGPGQLPSCNSLSASSQRGPAHQHLADLLLGPKAADQAPHHDRGLMAAGAYVLQPVEPGAGAPKRRSSSPEEQLWLQHVDIAAGPGLPSAAPTAPRQPQQQHQAPPDGDCQQAVIAQAGAAESAAAPAGKASAGDSAPDQHMVFMQQRQMLQQQQQRLWRLQQERRQQQQHRLPLPEMQRQMPPRQPQQHYQQPQQRQQYSQQSVQDMEVDADVQDAAGALDMLSEIAAAAAAAEEMYAGVPSPLRPDLLNAEALAATPGAFSNQPKPVARLVLTGTQPPKPAGRAGVAAAQAATNIPTAAAAAIAASEHSTGRRGGQAKRSRGSSDSAVSDAVAHAFAEAPPAVTKRTRMGDRHAAATAAGSAAAAMHAAGLQQQRGMSSSAGRAANASLGGGRAGSVFASVARPGFNAGPAAGSSLAAGSGMPAEAILAAVAELAALAAAAAEPAGQPASRTGLSSAAPPAQVQQTPQLAHGMQAAPGAQAPGRAGMPVAFLLRGAAAAGDTAYLMYPSAQFAQQGLAQQHGASSAALAVMQAAGLSAQGNSPAAAPAGGVVGQSAPLATTHAAHRPGTQPAGVYAADGADEAAHDLAMFAAAAAAAAAAGTYHRRPTAAPPAAVSHETHTEGRRQRKSAAAAAAFIAAALAPADDGMPHVAADDDDYDNSSEELRHNKTRPQKRHTHTERQQSPAAMNLDLLAAAASSPDLGAAADEEASAGLSAAAAAGGRHRGRGYNTGCARLDSGGSGSGNVLHGQEETSDAADGEVYVCEEEEGDGQDSDGEEHQSHSSKNRANNERVLSNRLAASRSYQRRKEEMLRLEHTNARLQVGCFFTRIRFYTHSVQAVREHVLLWQAAVFA